MIEIIKHGQMPRCLHSVTDEEGTRLEGAPGSTGPWTTIVGPDAIEGHPWFLHYVRGVEKYMGRVLLRGGA